MRSCSFYAPAVAEAVGRDYKEKILSFVFSAALSVEMRAMKTPDEATVGPTCGAVGREC